MKVNSLFRYFGGKSFLIDDIKNIIFYTYKKFKIQSIVDVFGGSGKILLNIPAEWKVLRIYNDIDDRLYNVFKVLQDDEKRKKLIEKLKFTFQHQKAFYDFRDLDKFQDDVDKAFVFLYLINYSINGVGNDFNWKWVYKIELSNSYIKRIEKFSKIIKKWVILNEDYRKIIKRVKNRHYVFLYLDPPYLQGGKNYKYGGWTIEDFKELKRYLDEFKGYWLMNESSIEEISKIFGKPKMVKEYINQSKVINYQQIEKNNTKKTIRKEGFWTNFDF